MKRMNLFKSFVFGIIIGVMLAGICSFAIIRAIKETTKTPEYIPLTTDKIYYDAQHVSGYSEHRLDILKKIIDNGELEVFQSQDRNNMMSFSGRYTETLGVIEYNHRITGAYIYLGDGNGWKLGAWNWQALPRLICQSGGYEWDDPNDGSHVMYFNITNNYSGHAELSVFEFWFNSARAVYTDLPIYTIYELSDTSTRIHFGDEETKFFLSTDMTSFMYKKTDLKYLGDTTPTLDYYKGLYSKRVSS